MARPMHCCMPTGTGHTHACSPTGLAWRGVVAACARVVRAQPIAPAACQPTTALAALWICQHQNGCCLGTGTGMDDVSPYHACASCSNSTHVHTGTCVAVPRAACMGPWPWIQPAMPVCVQAAMRPCWRNGQAYALLHAHRHRPHARMQPDWLGMAWRGGRMRSRGACPTQYPTQCTSSLPTYHCPCSVMAMPAPEWVLPRYWHWHGWWVPISCLRTVQQLNARAHRHVCGRATRGVHGVMAVAPACHTSVRALLRPCWRSGRAYALLQGHRHRRLATAYGPCTPCTVLAACQQLSQWHAECHAHTSSPPTSALKCCSCAKENWPLPWYQLQQPEKQALQVGVCQLKATEHGCPAVEELLASIASSFPC